MRTVLLILLTLTGQAWAQPLFSDTNLSVQYGDGYKQAFGNNKGSSSTGTVVTIENMASYQWGKHFLFIDRFSGSSIINDFTYGEFAVDFSLSNLLGSQLEGDWLKDAYIVNQWEMATASNSDNILTGIGARWKVSTNAFVDTNFYRRFQDKAGLNNQDNWQFTAVWMVPFKVGESRFVFNGFMDYATAFNNNLGRQSGVFHIQPQLKLDLGHYIEKSGTVFIGLELDIWRNKFAQAGVNETTPQIKLQVHF